MTDYTKDQEREALAHVEALIRPGRHHHLRVVLAMAKRTEAAEARADASEADAKRLADDWAAVLVERDALKARVEEMEAKSAPPTVAPTREVWEALREFVHVWAYWDGNLPTNSAARTVVAIRKMLEVGT